MKTALRNLTTLDYIEKMIDLDFVPQPRPYYAGGESHWPEHVLASVSEAIDNMPEGPVSDAYINQLRLTPTAPGYLPMFVPRNLHWLENAKEMFLISTQAAISEIYTKVFELKRDHKEKPLYIFWNHDVPKPTALSSLFWLMTCEAWPMPNHRLFGGVDGLQVDGRRVDSLSTIFPPQTVHLPQCSPLGQAGVQPTGFNLGHHAGGVVATKPLNVGFIASLTREDREKMDLTRPNPLVARPRKVQFTHLDAHRGNGPRLQWWSDTFPWTPMTCIDSGYAANEWHEAIYHHKELRALRDSVMEPLITSPGVPGSDAYANSFYDAPGLWIRNWSEQGIMVRGGHSLLGGRWTPKGEAIALASGQPIPIVPSVSPRVWFGFTMPEVGEKYVSSPDGKDQKRVPSASEEWLDAYLEHREIALRMLFDPMRLNLDDLIDNHLVKQEQRLKKAGRIKAASTKDLLKEQMSKFKFDL